MSLSDLENIIFGQINLQHSIPANVDLLLHIRKTLEQHNSIVVGMQEPHANSRNGIITSLPDRNLIYSRTVTNDGYSRAALFVSSNLHILPFLQFTNRDMATGIWNTGNPLLPTVVITSVYMDGLQTSVWPSSFKRLVDHCLDNDLPIIACSDCNSHSTLWGSLRTNPRGKKMEDFIFDKNLVVHNVGGLPSTWTWERQNSRTIVDVTLSSPDIADFMSDWRVTDNINTSDHRYIHFEVNISAPARIQCRNYKNGNWKRFNSILSRHTFQSFDCWTPELLDVQAKQLEDTIRSTLDITHPLKEVSPRISFLHWYDKDVAREKRNKKRAYDRWRRNRTAENHALLVLARRKNYVAIRKSKRKTWQSYQDNIINFSDVARFNKILNRKHLHQMGVLNRGDQVLNAEESLAFLADTHFPGCSDTAVLQPSVNSSCDIFDVAADFLTVDKVQEAFMSFGDYKAPGPDSFKPCVFKHLSRNVYEHITELYKACVLLGHTPANWRCSNVIFIPKPDKDTYLCPRSFRPISLITFMFKGLERATLWHLQDSVFADRPLNVNQHAFRKGRSTESALSNMVEYLEDSIIHKNVTVGVFLDIQGAFDNLTVDSMVCGLRDKQVPESIIQWYRNFLCTRWISVSYKGHLLEKFLTRGTPQGGVLSPIMWDLGFESFLELFPDSGPVKVVGFADDAALVATHRDPYVAIALAQSAIDTALQWGARNGLHFAHKKTVSVIFTRRLLDPNLPKLKLGDKAIKYVQTVTYLGVLLHSQLNWMPHIKQKIAKARGLLFKVRNAAGKLWGLNPKMMLWLYTMIVKPMIVYAALIWARGTLFEPAQTKLTSLQRLALTSMGHFRHSTPTAGLEVITNTIPLWMHIRQEASLGYLRTKHLVKLPRERLTVFGKPFTTGHRQVCETFLVELGYVEKPVDDIQPEQNWHKRYVVDVSSFNDGKPLDDDGIMVYTDGSRSTDGRVGAGVVIFNDNDDLLLARSFHLHRENSVYQAELYGIQQALVGLFFRRTTGCNITFYCDNQAALLAINGNFIRSSQVLAIVRHLNVLGLTNTISLRWVKAHVGHKGNEAADLLAKEGATDVTNRAPDFPNPANTHVRSTIRELFRGFWNQWWRDLSTCRQTKHFFPNLSAKKSFLAVTHNRRVFSAVVQFYTGHNFLNRHESIVQVGFPQMPDSWCRLCGDGEESTHHLLAECEPLGALRFDIWGEVDLFPPFHLSSKSIIDFLRRGEIPTFGDLLV